MNIQTKITVIAMSLLTTISPALAQKFTTFELETSTLHLYASGNGMNDVSFIVEGDTSLVVLEQPLYYEHIKEFGEYIAALDKPIEKVFANYHICGITPYPLDKIVMPKSMVEYSQTPAFEGLKSYLETEFKGKADLNITNKSEVIELPSSQVWAGINFKLSKGVVNDFPAAGVIIDNSAYCTHFAPISGTHVDEWVITSADAIDARLQELRYITASGVKYIIGSHSPVPSTMKDVTFQIEYLSKLKEIYESSSDAETFENSLISTFPNLENSQYVKVVAKNLYPSEKMQ